MIIEKSKCSGCGACAVICPKNCIEMKKDSEGFLYPETSKTCNECGLCEKICPVLNKRKTENETVCHAVKNKDEKIRENSSSGGVFYALAKYVIKNGGYVCGAVYDDDFYVRHIITNSLDVVMKMKGAKYSQSVSYDSFEKIKSLLDEEKKVLFVSTPCQVAGIKGYLKKDYENLITVDMICHGVPSPAVFKKYLAERVAIDGGDKIKSINLRDKSSGWSKYAYSVKIEYENGKTYLQKQGNDIFLRGFVSNLYLRPSCAECSFKGINRHSDFTLGDYWGIWNSHTEFDDDKGVSLLLVNSDKARWIFDEIKGEFEVIKTDVNEALSVNKSATESSVPHPKREEFFEKLSSLKMTELAEEILIPKPQKMSLIARIINKIKGT